MRATIRDVSREAGVSIKTVSRVLNGERYVGAETRAKVEAAVVALDFRPNTAARSLAGRRADQVALIGVVHDAEALLALFAGVRERCVADGKRATLHPIEPDDLIAEVAALVESEQLDGMVLGPGACDDRDVLALLAGEAVRTVRVLPGFDPHATPSVAIDDARAAAEMTAYLLTLDHRRVAFVGVAPQRAAGTRAALEAAEVFDPELIVAREPDFDALSQLLAGNDPPTAIVAASDAAAAAVLAAAHRLGVSVPERLSVAGFGNALLARQVWPALTTVHVPLKALGWNAADLLLSDVAEDRRVLPYDLIVRDSTAFADGPG